MKTACDPRRPVCLLCAVWLLLATTGLFFCACSCAPSSPPPDAASVLAAMQSAATELPAGQVFSRRADPAGADHLSDMLFAALFGPAARGWLADASDVSNISDPDQTEVASTGAIIQDAALFLSVAPHPAELVVLRCTDSVSALSAAALCRERLSTLCVMWDDTAYAAWVAGGQVTVSGTFVLFAVSPAADDIVRAGMRACAER